MNQLTHLNSSGEAHMVDIGEKKETQREATAQAWIYMLPETLQQITNAGLKKGDALATARIAGIMAAKKTSALIPLCHPIDITHVSIDITPHPKYEGFHIVATCRTLGQTGIEMEALTAVTVCALTMYDMAKAIDKGMTIEGISLVKKKGGKSGDWSRYSLKQNESIIE